jgi:hypothetical protein
VLVASALSFLHNHKQNINTRKTPFSITDLGLIDVNSCKIHHEEFNLKHVTWKATGNAQCYIEHTEERLPNGVFVGWQQQPGIRLQLSVYISSLIRPNSRENTEEIKA